MSVIAAVHRFVKIDNAGPRTGPGNHDRNSPDYSRKSGCSRDTRCDLERVPSFTPMRAAYAQLIYANDATVVPRPTADRYSDWTLGWEAQGIKSYGEYTRTARRPRISVVCAAVDRRIGDLGGAIPAPAPSIARNCVRRSVVVLGAAGAERSVPHQQSVTRAKPVLGLVA
jgi:hypothetical protein